MRQGYPSVKWAVSLTLGVEHDNHGAGAPMKRIAETACTAIGGSPEGSNAETLTPGRSGDSRAQTLPRRRRCLNRDVMCWGFGGAVGSHGSVLLVRP